MEHFSRTELILGKEGLDKLQNSFVAVVGLGAVGSYATEALARAGVGKFLLVDHDVIRPSNINRHIWAFHSTLNQPKTALAENRLKDINPRIQTTIINSFIDQTNVSDVLAYKPDILIDAIDSSNPKACLLEACFLQKQTVISSMGAATRTDPQCIKVDDLMNTRHCPLARRMKKLLKTRGVGEGITCVYSTELSNRNFLSENATQPVDGLIQGRPRRTMGSLSTITGIFGLTIANVIIKKLV